MFKNRGPLQRLHVFDCLGELANVLRCCAAAPTHDRDTEFCNEAFMELNELLCGQVVMHESVHYRRQAGIW